MSRYKFQEAAVAEPPDVLEPLWHLLSLYTEEQQFLAISSLFFVSFQVRTRGRAISLNRFGNPDCDIYVEG